MCTCMCVCEYVILCVCVHVSVPVIHAKCKRFFYVVSTNNLIIIPQLNRTKCAVYFIHTHCLGFIQL